MIKKDLEILSEYYQNELSYLRSAGSDFAIHYPKIAKRLDFAGYESSDPNIEYLIESVAFLTGKLQKQIDDQFPEIATTLLNMLYKPLLLPMPSCVMANFDIDMTRAPQNVGVILPKGSDLQATSDTGEICHFRTAHDVQFWPIELQSVEFISREELPAYYGRSLYYIKLNFMSEIQDVRPEKLRIYFTAKNVFLRSKIYASIFESSENIIFQKDDSYEFLGKPLSVGCDPAESLFYDSGTVFSGFRLLQEYFAFADKFYGLDVVLPSNVDISGNFSLIIPAYERISAQLSTENFSLYSVPAINLFPKISEPIRLDYRQVSYPLVADYRQYVNHEIYTIEKMVAVDPRDDVETIVPEFFQCHYDMSEDGIFWISQRTETHNTGVRGDEVYVSFVDTNFKQSNPTDKVFYAHCLCTNRYCAEQVPARGRLQVEASIPAKNIYCESRPTPQKSTIKSGKILWKLISFLSLNSLSFDKNGLDKLKTLLNVFVEINASNLNNEVNAIIGFDSTLSIKRFDEQAWKGFTRGMNVEITFNDELVNRGLPLSFVIANFLASYTTINTFVDVIVMNTAWNRSLRTWTHQLGNREYL